jgi:hypothetical protein
MEGDMRKAQMMTLPVLLLITAVMIPSLAQSEERLPEASRSGTVASDQGVGMKFLLTFTGKGGKENREEAIARFKKTRGQPPKGIKLLGRWTSADFSKVYVVVEIQDSKALAQYAYEWSDVAAVQAVPVIEDEQLVQLLDR